MSTSTSKPGEKAADHKTSTTKKADDKSHSGSQHKPADSQKQTSSTTKK